MQRTTQTSENRAGQIQNANRGKKSYWRVAFDMYSKREAWYVEMGPAQTKRQDKRRGSSGDVSRVSGVGGHQGGGHGVGVEGRAIADRGRMKRGMGGGY